MLCFFVFVILPCCLLFVGAVWCCHIGKIIEIVVNCRNNNKVDENIVKVQNNKKIPKMWYLFCALSCVGIYEQTYL